MNKRIEELKAKAGIYTDTSGRWMTCTGVDEFVKLLILECASQCDTKSGLKYSPNAASSREECKHNILNLLN